MDFDLKHYFSVQKNRVDKALDKWLPETTAVDKIVEAMRYSLMAGGKRIRPILCLAAAEAVGGTAETALTAACAAEMIHTYSLIHDDLPAMDDDDLRRGKPTCHMAFDEATAILAGDGLLTLAFEVLSSMEGTNRHLQKTLKVINAFSRAGGYRGMIEGQMHDMHFEGKTVTLKDLEQMYALKTGALIEASVYAGAVLGGAGGSQIESLIRFARHIGLAFQVSDDILDIEGDPAVMGKPRGSDEKRKKSTYPALIGIGASRRFARKLVDSAITALDVFDHRCDPLKAIAAFIIKRNK